VLVIVPFSSSFSLPDEKPTFPPTHQLPFCACAADTRRRRKTEKSVDFLLINFFCNELIYCLKERNGAVKDNQGFC